MLLMIEKKNRVCNQSNDSTNRCIACRISFCSPYAFMTILSSTHKINHVINGSVPHAVWIKFTHLYV